MHTIKRFACQQARPAPYLALRPQRQFSFTPRAHARIRRPSELGSSLSPAVRKLLNNPEALKALDEVQQLMQRKGVDPTTGPTTMQMFWLLSSAEFRKAGKKLKEELKKANLDLADQELLTAWKDLQRRAGRN